MRWRRKAISAQSLKEIPPALSSFPGEISLCVICVSVTPHPPGREAGRKAAAKRDATFLIISEEQFDTSNPNH